MRARLSWTYSSCLQAQRSRAVNHAPAAVVYRPFTTAAPLSSPHASLRQDEADHSQKTEKEEGAMSRRLSEMTEESIETGGRSAANNVEAAGFSEDLKKQLEARIAEGAFRSQNQRAFAEAEIPVWFSFYSLISMQFLTDNSLPLAKALEIKRPLNPGWALNLSTIHRFECWTTATNVYTVFEHLGFLNQPPYDLHLERLPQLVNGLPTLEITPPSTLLPCLTR
jgi:hypothetical protein